jgi:hypothetical protein
MNRFVCRAALAALALTPLLALAQEGMPRRKPGLWETTMQMPGRPGAPLTAQHCIDAKTDEQAQRKALEQDAGARCEQRNVKRSAGSYEAEYSCQGPRGKTEGKMTLKGDFESRYTMHNQMRFDPPRGGRSEATVTMEGQWKGACPEGMKPGEMRMSGMPAGPGGRQMTPEQSERLKQMMERMRQQQPQAPAK